MKKVIIRALSLMLALMMVFGNATVTASAAVNDTKAKTFCKTLNKGNKFKTTVGSFKVSYKKKGSTYNFTITLNSKVGAGVYQMMKSMTPDKYDELIKGFEDTTLQIRKKAKKAGIKKANVKYVVKSNGEKLWEFKNGKLIYDKFE